jgi:hypothetical protein
MLRGDGQINPDGVRDYELLVPMSVEALTIERHATARETWLREADAWRASTTASGSVGESRPGG